MRGRLARQAGLAGPLLAAALALGCDPGSSGVVDAATTLPDSAQDVPDAGTADGAGHPDGHGGPDAVASDAAANDAPGSSDAGPAPDGAAAPAAEVAAAGTAFVPANITINVGDTVRWTSGGSHTVTSGTGAADPNAGALFDATIGPGATFAYTFTSAGTYPYFCRPHEAYGMKGSVTVNP